jgi:transposase
LAILWLLGQDQVETHDVVVPVGLFQLLIAFKLAMPILNGSITAPIACSRTSRMAAAHCHAGAYNNSWIIVVGRCSIRRCSNDDIDATASRATPPGAPRRQCIGHGARRGRPNPRAMTNAKAVLKMQINKSDRNDAAGIARIMQTGWFKEVRVKDLDSHSVRALLASRALLVKIKRDLENQIRGLLKNVGLVIGRAKFNVFAVRAEELIEDRPELIAVVEPLLKARKAIEQQTDDLDRKVLKLARHDAQVRRFMTVPGVGPITALCFKATIDDPTRFKRSRSVGAYVGLTTRRHASGETDWTGRISKCGDAMLRSYLFEAANVLLARVPKWSALKAWGMRLAKRNGLRKAKVAVARKLAVILHRMWIDGTEFNWSKKEVAA